MNEKLDYEFLLLFITLFIFGALILYAVVPDINEIILSGIESFIDSAISQSA